MWSVQKANQWYEKQGWIVGANFIPSTAANQLEMWQADTFDPELIDRELSYAQKLGFNAMRVFLHNLLWEYDREGFLTRFRTYLSLAAARGMKTVPVLLDGVGNPRPQFGSQLSPIPFVHNSRWLQSPGLEYLRDSARQSALQDYIQGILAEFSADERILIWDLFNEPNNVNFSYISAAWSGKARLAYELLVSSFQWAREVNPSQPVTSAVWQSAGIIGSAQARKFNTFLLAHSDVITFHSYEGPGNLEKRIRRLQQTGRPVICTEYMARPQSTFAGCLPLMKQYGVGCFSWGLVSGKTQTIYPWTSWVWRSRKLPKVWFHDVFQADGTPFDETETAQVKKIISNSAAV